MEKLSVKQSFRLLHKILSYSVVGLLFLIMLGMTTACSTANYATHEVSETPTMRREAIIYDDHVVIVTRQRFTVEQYNRLVANTIQNREERN